MEVEALEVVRSSGAVSNECEDKVDGVFSRDRDDGFVLESDRSSCPCA